MRTREAVVRGVVTLAIPILGLSPAVAGTAESDGRPPTSGSSSGSGWNPAFTCTTQPGDTLVDMFECLADGLEYPPGNPCPPGAPQPTSPPGGGGYPVDLNEDPPDPAECSDPMAREDYTVTPLGYPWFGIRILRLDGSEIDRLYFWENDPSIQRTAIQVNRPGLIARLGVFVQNPSRPGGPVVVTLDGIPVVVDTSRFRKADELTGELLLRLRLAGFEAGTLGPDHIAVVRNTATGLGITRVEFNSGDPAIRSSDLALVPLAEVIEHLQGPLIPQ